MTRCVVEAGQAILARVGRVVDRRVVADEDQLDALQAEHPVGLGPAAVVAGGQPDARRRRRGGRRNRPGRARSSAARDAGTAATARARSWPGRWILRYRATSRPSRVDQDRRVVVVARPSPPSARRTPRLTKPSEKPSRAGPRRTAAWSSGPGISALEEGVELGLVVDPPAGEEGGERQLGERHQLGAPAPPRRAAGRPVAPPPQPGCRPGRPAPSGPAADPSRSRRHRSAPPPPRPPPSPAPPRPDGAPPGAARWRRPRGRRRRCARPGCG